LADGADRVDVAMHIDKRPMEPRIGHERLAAAEFLKRGVARVHAGPDVWEPTKTHYPAAFAGDGVHPSSIGNEIMTHSWFEALRKREGLTVPDWSREMEQAIAGKSGK
jgi:hypothetical protein